MVSRVRQAKRDAQAVLKSTTSTAKEKRDALAISKSTGKILKATKATKGQSLEDLRGLRETAMTARGGAVGSAAKIEEANLARAYADAMRMLTGREKAEGTRYTGPGVQGLVGDEPAIDPGAYTKRYMDPTTTKYQDINLQRMLALEGTIPERREEFRALWGDPGSEDYAAMQEWQRQQLAAGGAPTPKWLTDAELANLNNTNLNNLSLNLNQGTSAFQHPYAADDYTVPNMQTGGLWEGLGAEYQPGTVEGLGLIAGDAYAPYEPLARGLLDAGPSYMGDVTYWKEGGAIGQKPYETGLSGTTNSKTKTNTKNTGPVFAYNPAGKWVQQ